MGTFSDQMQLDTANTFLDSQGFAEAALYYPVGAGGVTTANFPITVVVGDPAESVQDEEYGQQSQRVATIFSQKSVIAAGILAATSSARDSMRGDLIVIAAPSPDAGTWIVQGPPSQDLGDGAGLLCTLPLLDAPGAQGARRVR